jgi:phosphoribosylformimino-5-aminoimidazole carboxamide ribonucleotide (ProFAR) isomerase
VVRGWTEDTGMALGTFAREMRESGVRHLLVTAVERDGTGEGPALDVLGEAVGAFGHGVIASGGIGTVEHLGRLGPLVRRGLDGVIVGSLLVDGKATVRELIDATRGL